MQMRRPVAVARRRADRGKGFARGDGLAGAELRQTFAPQVAVKREELHAGAGLMAQDHDGAVVVASGVVVPRMDNAGQRRADGRTRRREEVDAQVQRAPLRRRAGAERKGRAGVEGARLGVAPDADCGASFRQLAEDGGAEQPGEVVGALAVQHRRGDRRAADGEVEHVRRREIDAEHRGERTGSTREPVDNLGGVWNRRQIARSTQRVLRLARMNLRQLFQRRPRRLFADREVLVLRLARALVRSVADADAQPHTGQLPQRGDLGGGERVGGVIAGRHLRHGLERVGLVEQGVGGGDRQVGHAQAVHHVAQVEDAGDAPEARKEIAVAGDQHVVIVGVAVDHLAGQGGKLRRGFRLEARQQLSHQRPARRRGNLPACARTTSTACARSQ